MKKVILFFLAVVAADQIIGRGLAVLYRRCLTGENGGLVNYALTRNADVLVLGSSRAQHNFVPAILSRRLGLRVYNAGLDGQDFLYSMMFFDLWTARHRPPKLVILQVDPLTFERSDYELQHMSVFAPYVDQSASMRKIYVMRGRYEPLKLLSYCYRYNGKVLAILKNFRSRPAPGFDGYVGLPAGGDPLDMSVQLPNHNLGFWDEKVALFEGLEAYCRRNDVRLLLVHTPHLASDPHGEDRWRAQMKTLLSLHPEADFIDADIVYPKTFQSRPDLFHDTVHLNDQGAKLFSSLLADDLARPLIPKRLPLRAVDLASKSGGPNTPLGTQINGAQNAR